MKKDIFDEIIGHLRELQTQDKTTFIAPEIVNEFFTDTQAAPKPESVSVPAQASVPADPVDPAIASMTLEELNSSAQKCQKCPLCTSRKNVVFGEGSPNADLMFIGLI